MKLGIRLLAGPVLLLLVAILVSTSPVEGKGAGSVGKPPKGAADNAGGTWTFDSGLPLDSSGNGNDGRLSSGASIAGGQLQLNGAGGFMVVTDSLSLRPAAGVYIEMDAYFDQIRSSWIVDKMSDDYTNGYRLRTFSGTNRLGFYVGTGTESLALFAYIQTGRWYHILAIYDGNFAALYIDGKRVDYTEESGQIGYAGTGNLYIGSSGGTRLFLDGTLDNISIGYSTHFPLAVGSNIFPGGRANTPFLWRLEGFGGTPPYTWTANGLPSGLTLNSASSAIEGTTMSEGDFQATITLRDSASPPISQTLVLSTTFVDQLAANIGYVSGAGTYRFATNSKRSNPQIVYHKGTAERLYAVYQNVNLDPEVVSYDYATGSWSLPVKVGINPMKSDQHGHPTIILDAQGYVHVFYGSHSSPLLHSISARPEDISEWVEQPRVGSRVTYPDAIALPDGRMLLFYASGGTDTRKYAMLRSYDNGRSWEPNETILVDWGPNFIVYPDGGVTWDPIHQRIHTLWTLYDVIAHRHSGVFYAFSDDLGLTWRKSDGSVTSLPINQSNADTVYYNPDEINAGADAISGEQANPIVLFHTSSADGTNKRKVLGYPSAGGWQLVTVTNEGSLKSSSAMNFDPIGHMVNLYIAQGPDFGSSPQLEWWTVDALRRPVLRQVIEPLPGRQVEAFQPKIIEDPSGKTKILFQASTRPDASFLLTYDQPCGATKWRDLKNLTELAGGLHKTGGGNHFNGGGVSTRSISGGDGSVQATVASTNDYVFFGLSNGSSGQGYEEIDFALYTYPPTNQVVVYEGGLSKARVSGYAQGDILKVAIEDGRVRYYRNSTLIYTSATTPSYPLLVDTSLYNLGSQLSNTLLCGALTDDANGGPTPTPTPVEDVTWMQLNNATAQGNTLIKSGGGNHFNGGAVSTRAISSGDGSVQATVASTNDYVFFGLSNGSSGQGYEEIDFALYTYPPTNQVVVYEGGLSKARVSGYAQGDILKVAIEGGRVRYYRNGILIYNSASTPTYPLLADTSLYNLGGRVAGAQLSGSVLATGASLRKKEAHTEEIGCGATFADVGRDDYYYVATKTLACRGVISGYDGGYFRPTAVVTRGQLAKIIALANGWQLIDSPIPTFTDVPPEDPFYEYVETAAAYGVIGGYTGPAGSNMPGRFFRPYAAVTRGQLAKVLVLSMGLPLESGKSQRFADVSPGSTFYNYVESVYEHGLMEGYQGDLFQPQAPATRGQVAKVVYIAINH